jgi:hypothetical protein
MHTWNLVAPTTAQAASLSWTLNVGTPVAFHRPPCTRRPERTNGSSQESDGR